MADTLTITDNRTGKTYEVPITDGTIRLSMEQAKAILDLRLQRLTALGREEIAEELEKLKLEINDYLEILRSRARVQAIVKTELSEVKAEFATPRRTVIIEQEGEVEDEDLIQRDDDQEVTVKKRLDVYHSQTKPLVEYYGKWAATGDAKAPKCRKIAGVGSVDDIKNRALDALK